MGFCSGVWPVFVGVFWLVSVSALPLGGRGDVFQVKDAQENDLHEARSPPDDILDINQELILPEAPESSFLLEGDIVKVSPFRMSSAASPRWPKKRGIVQVPYIISYKYDRSSVKTIMEAFEDFARHTCVQFVPYSYQRDFVAISPSSGCFSNIGRIGGMQVLSLAPACLRRGKGVALHELMHVLGFWHEHSRADRDEYIAISWNEILSGLETNFMKSWNTNMLVGYDYSSVMHYGRHAFSMTGLPTIRPLSSPYTILGQRWNLSHSDVARVNKLYNCSRVAAWPETSTASLNKENVMDLLPSKLEPCSNKSTVNNISATWSATTYTTETAYRARDTPWKPQDLAEVVTALPLSKAVEESSGITEAQLRTSSPRLARHNQSTVSLETLSEADGRLLMATGGQLPSLEMETMGVWSTSQKSNEPHNLQRPASSTEELGSQPSYTQAYTPRGQSPTQAMMMRSVPGTVLAGDFPTQSPIPPTDVTEMVARVPGESALPQPLPGTRGMGVEQTTELPTPAEDRSSKFKDGNGSLSPTEEESVPGMENQTKGPPKGLLRPTINHSGNETGSPNYVHSMGDVHAKATSSSYRTPPPRAPGNLLVTSDVGTSSIPAGSQTAFTIGSHRGIVETEVGSFYSKNESAPAFTWASHSRGPAAVKEVEHRTLPPPEEAAAFGHSDAQDGHLGPARATAGAPYSEATIVAHLAASRWKEASPKSSPMGSPISPLEREGYKQQESATPPPRHSLKELDHTTLEKWSPGLSELPSQALTPRELALPKVETKQAIYPTEGTSLRGLSWSQSPGSAQPKGKALWSQPSQTEGYSSSVIEGLASLAGMQGKNGLVPHATEVASITTVEKQSTGQKASVGPEEGLGGKTLVGTERPEEAKTYGKASLWQVLFTRSPGSQMRREPGCGMAETRRQKQSPTHSVETLPGRGNVDTRTRNPIGLRTTSPRQCSGKVPSSLYPEQTTKGRASLDTWLKQKVTREGSPRTVQGHGSTSSGRLVPGSEIAPSLSRRSTAPSWASLSRELGERMGHYTGSLQDETSAAASDLAKPHNGTPVSDQGTAEAVHAGSVFSTALALVNPTQQRMQPPHSVLLPEGAESVTNAGSPPAQLLKLITERRGSSKSREMRPSAKGRPEPANATQEALIHGPKWVTSHGWKSKADRIGETLSSWLEVQPTLIPYVSTEEKALPLSLASPKSITYGEEATSRSSKGSMSSARKMVGIAMALPGYSAIPLKAEESQSIPSDAGEATSRASKRSEETAMETHASTLTGNHRAGSAGTAVLGSHGRHAAAEVAVAGVLGLPLHSEAWVERQEGTRWPAGGLGEGTKSKSSFMVMNGKSPTKKSGVHEYAKTTAMDMDTSPKKSVQSSTGMLKGATLGTRTSWHLYTKETREPTTFHGKQGTMHSLGGPMSKQTLEMIGAASSGNGKTSEMPSSMASALTSPGSEKMEAVLPSEMSLEKRSPASAESTKAGATNTASVAHPISAGLRAWGIQLHATPGPGGVYGNRDPLTKMTPGRMERGKRLVPSAEASSSTSETQTVVRLDEIELAQKGSQSRHHPSFLHLHKRAVPERTATLEQERGYNSEPSLISRCLGLSKWKMTGSAKPRALLKKHLSGISMVSPVKNKHHLPPKNALKYFNQVHLYDSATAHMDGVFTVAKVTKPIGMSASSIGSSHLVRGNLPGEMAGNTQLVPQRTGKACRLLTFCAFKQDLCGWEQSKEDDLDWMLEQEQPVDGQSILGTPCRISGGHISLKPSTSQVPSKRAVLISPVMHGVRCLKFWYSSMDSLMGKINVYVKLLETSEWCKVWSTKEDQGRAWHPVAIPISGSSRLQVALEGVVGHGVESSVGIDELFLCRNPCQKCFNMKSFLCK